LYILLLFEFEIDYQNFKFQLVKVLRYIWRNIIIVNRCHT